jgi:hypothetical protein
VSDRRKVLAEFLPTEPETKSVGSTRVGDIQKRAVIEPDLRVIFRIDGSWVTTLDVGTRKLYRT